MVAKITVPSSIKRVLNYNEQKVGQDKAKCLLASGFLKDAKNLNFYEKLARFESLIQLNSRATTNTVHISLNFAEGEQLPEEKLKEIATAYMEKIGFSAQPFLVYEHRDAGHPHLHLVTTNIQRDGRRISLHNLGKGASEKARKELEVQFRLQRAGEKKNKEMRQVEPGLAPKAVYGKGPTKRAITNVLDAILPHYKYTSLPELNAVLRRHNVLADRGAEEGVIYRNRGLLYHVLDERGKKVGVPVKASSIYSKPTLAYLEQKFKENDMLKQAYRKQLQTAIDWVMVRPPRSLAGLEKALAKENIALVIRQNEQGFVYGLTYIDHRTKSVFNGSELGKPYSAKAVLERCGLTPVQIVKNSVRHGLRQDDQQPLSNGQKNGWNADASLALFDRLLTEKATESPIPFAWRKGKKKRRKL